MDLATLILLAIKASIFMQVFCIGLNATPTEALYLIRRPSELLRSIASMNVVMPVVAAALVLSFEFEQAVKIALLTLAVSPIPPILPKKQLKAGGRSPYTIGLLAGVSLLSIIVVPIAVYLVGKAVGAEASIPPAKVAQLMTITVLLPLAAGIAFRRVAPTLAEQMAKPLSLVATILLLVGAIPILIVAWPAIVSLVKAGGILPITVFVLMGLAIGHLFGGPDPDDRTVLALSTATRHPGVALAIASANNSGGNKAVLAAVLLYMIVNGIVSIPYVNWRKHHQARLAAAA
jgi:BASS family bile acid:Na+ symporter